MTTSLSLDLFRDDECFEVDCDYLIEEGCYSGPPENCYPSSEELTVNGVFNAAHEKLADFIVTEAEHEGLLEKAREAVAEAEERHAAAREDAEGPGL